MSYASSFHEGAQPAGGALHQSRAPTRDRLELHYRKIGIAAVAAALVARNFEPPSPQILSGPRPRRTAPARTSRADSSSAPTSERLARSL